MLKLLEKNSVNHSEFNSLLWKNLDVQTIQNECGLGRTYYKGYNILLYNANNYQSYKFLETFDFE